jgi:hypothetical protein
MNEASSPSIPPALQSEQAPAPDRSLVRLWAGVLLPPLGWVADLLSRYLLVRWVNVHDVRWPLHLATAICQALVAAGALLSWRTLAAGRRLRRVENPIAETARDARVTMGLWGLGLALFFLLLILAQAFPSFVLSPREIT